MQLVEQHCIDCHDPRIAAIDPACFASKNLYNAALYILRQAFFMNRKLFYVTNLQSALILNPEMQSLIC